MSIKRGSNSRRNRDGKLDKAVHAEFEAKC
jgi:hypothetical protein